MGKPSGQIEIERNGRTYTADWKLERGMVTVEYWDEEGVSRQQTTQLGGMPPEILARRLLDEIVSAIASG